MKVNATELRQNLYHIIDTVLETGESVEIVRKGRIARIVADRRPSVWDRLEVHELIPGNPEDVVHVDWSREWRPEPQ